MKKKLTLALAIALALCAVLGALTVSAGGARVELQFWHYFSMSTYEVMLEYIDAYNKDESNPAIIVEQYIPRNDLLKKYTLGVVSGDLPDLAMIDNPDSAPYAAMGMFADLTERFAAWEGENSYVEGPLNSGIYDGKNYTLPIRSNCLSVWSNDAMLKAAGVDAVPETWDEFFAVCEKIKAANPNVYPFAFCAGKSEEGTFQYIPFLYSTGATIETFGSPEGVKALGIVTDLVQKGYASAEVINWTQNDVEKQFAAGNCAMMLNGCWHISNMKNDAPDLAYTISYLPKDTQFASCMGGENLGITANSANQDAAWDFMSYFLSKEVNVPFNTRVGTIAPHADVTADEQYPDNPVMRKFIDQLAYAVPRGPSPKWGEISTAVQDALQAALTGTKSPADAAAEAAGKIEKINASLK